MYPKSWDGVHLFDFHLDSMRFYAFLVPPATFPPTSPCCTCLYRVRQTCDALLGTEHVAGESRPPASRLRWTWSRSTNVEEICVGRCRGGWEVLRTGQLVVAVPGEIERPEHLVGCWTCLLKQATKLMIFPEPIPW